MKKILCIIGALVMLVTAGCGGQGEAQSEQKQAAGKNVVATSQTENVKHNFTLQLQDKQVKVELNNSTAAQELYQNLPQEMKFESFNENEKISYLPQKLKNLGKRGHAPKVGDLCYYIPWGNLCVFMKDYKYTDDLICVGQVTSNLETITSQNGNFTMEVVKPHSKILVAYFTWADNTQVANPQAVDVDASTSASVLAPGNVAKIASWIQEGTQADTFSIVTVNPYDSDYNKCLEQADRERKTDARPALTRKVQNMQDYDVVFLGYPNWWGSVPYALYTFIQENDLSGKKIIPFCGHGTGGMGTSIEDLKAHLPQSATVEKAIGVYRPDTDKARPKVEAWLKNLGYGK